jgi:hypothetical protein
MRGRIFLGGAALAGAAVFAAVGAASGPDGPTLTTVPSALPKAAAYAPASQLSPELRQTMVAQGSMPLENPQGIIGWYGYENDAPSADNPALPQMVPAPGGTTEAQKTEPDKNTYLVLENQTGADPNSAYGTHFLFQGHEAAARDAQGNKLGYITRINLDADTAHRVTLLASKDVTGAPISTIDGSTWDPWAQRLLLTTESTSAPIYAATAGYPSQVEDVSGALGRGGYEGIQNDSAGNLWIVEDIGGAVKGATTAKQPNSFVYRYVPAKPGDLKNGRLQALQVLNHAGQPITVESQAALMAPDQVAVHSYGVTLPTRWVTVHDTAVDGTAPFNANTAAKAAKATPFKRPENGVFRPGSKFRDFYFSETGDTNATSPENGDPTTGAGGAGGWGGVFELTQSSPSASTGRITMLYRGNQSVTGLDNIQFLSRDLVTLGEDAGDTLHTQRKALDSAYVFDVETDYSTGAQPTRWLAEGRDPSATLDAGAGGFGRNDGDNEITGIHVSNGDPGPDGILGARTPHLDHGEWRWFWTQQHGDNVTWEVTLASEDH